MIRSLLPILGLAAVLCGQAVCAQTTAFTYQGRLNDNGAPAEGIYDLRFTIYDAVTSGDALGIVTNAPTTVSNGLFTVQLDFGANVFNGSARWLEIGVRTNGDAGLYSALNPRQPVTSTPYAIQAANAASAVTALSANTAGVAASANAVAATNIAGKIPDANLSTNVALLDGSVSFSGAVSAANFSGNGSGLTNVPGAVLWQTVVGTNQAVGANQAYLLTNDVLTTLTLPTNANVGDVITVSGVGSGEWAVAPNSGQTIVGSFLPAGAVWTPREANRSWRSVASSADGSKLVAVVQGGQIYTSTDSGIIWTARENNRPWMAVASSVDGSKLVAVVQGGQIYTSTDSGIIWTAREANRSWMGVASSADGSKLVAVASSSQIYTSTDSGVNWTARETIRSWEGIASSADGSKLVAVGGGGTFTSTDSGVNWTMRNLGPSSFVASSADGSRLVTAPFGGQIYTSADSGVSWTAHENNRYWRSVASSADGSKLVAVVTGGQIFTSADSGVSWEARETNRYWIAVTSSADGDRLVAAANDGQIYTSLGGSLPLSGSADETFSFHYVGGGQWQPSGVRTANLVRFDSNQAITEAQRIGLGSSNPLASLEIQAGADADGSGDLRALSFAYRTGGYRHWIRSRHNGVLGGMGNALDFYLNNTNTPTGSSAPGTGNALVMSLNSGKVGIGTNTPTTALHVVGTATATQFAGDGSTLSNLNASQLTSGTVSDVRLSANVALLNGTNVFSATNRFAGVTLATNANNQFTGSFTGNGGGLTNLAPASINGTLVAAQIPNLDASKINSGVLAIAQLPAAAVTNNATSVALTGSFTGNGSGLTNLNAANLTNTIADLRLSANVVLLNGTNIFSATNRFAGVVLATNLNNQFTGAFTGNGGGLTNLAPASINGTLSTTQIPNLDASKINSGALALAQLPAAAVTNNGANVTLAGTFSGNGGGLTNLTPASINGALNAAQIPNLDASKITSGTFTGNGGGLTNLDAANLTNTVADARLSTNVALLNRTNLFNARVGINTTNPLALLEIQAGGDGGGVNDQKAIALAWRNGGYRHWIRTRHNGSGSAGNAIDFYTATGGTASTSSAPGTGSSLAMTVNGGRVGVGAVADPQSPLHIKAEADDANFNALRLESAASSSDVWNIGIWNSDLIFRYGGNGSPFAWIDNANGQIGSGSDRRLKKDIEPLDSMLEKTLELRPVSYRFNEQNDSEPKSFGFIAQEVEEIFPNIVTERDGYKGITYDSFIPVAIGSIQELNQKVEDRNSEIHHLQKQNEKLEKQNQDLAQRLSNLEELVRRLANQN